MRASILFLAVALTALSLPSWSDDSVLFEYDRRSDGIAAEVQDPTPRLRVYASGRVLAYYPLYMKRAGLWEGRLSPTELKQLLSALEARGVFNLDANELEQAAIAAQRRKSARTGSYTYRSETVTSLFRAHAGAQAAWPLPDHELTVRNLQPRARALAVPELRALADAERLLLDLSSSGRLHRVGDATVIEARR